MWIVPYLLGLPVKVLSPREWARALVALGVTAFRSSISLYRLTIGSHVTQVGIFATVMLYVAWLATIFLCWFAIFCRSCRHHYFGIGGKLRVVYVGNVASESLAYALGSPSR